MLCLSYASLVTTPLWALLPCFLFGVRCTASRRMDPELYAPLISSWSGIFWLALVTFVADLSHIAGNRTGLLLYQRLHNKLGLRFRRGARSKK
jgi:hypothetical protein